MESQSTLVALSAVLILGIGSQWLASRLHLPAILVLLAAGLVAGPATGFIVPEELFGDLLLPMVSLAIAVILFEGAMTLRLSELKAIGRPLFMLLTVGVLLTWLLAGSAAYYLLRFGATEAILLGSILTVTGPTVVGPMLQHIRLIGNVGPLARWEGIVVDPIGAVLAVLTFAASRSIQDSTVRGAAWSGAVGFVETFLVGALIGLAAAWLLWLVLKKHWVSDHLDSPLALAFVVFAFTTANLLHHEAGLVSVTVMGLALANQHSVNVSRIISFKENLTVLLISGLFIILTTRLNIDSFTSLGWRGAAFLATVILVVRPVSVFVSTIGSGMPFSERTFLAWLAPRGIVAAAVASVFSLEIPNGDRFVAAAFLVILGTCFVYGLTASWVSRRLGLSIANPQGVLIASAHAGARAIAQALLSQGIAVRVVDTNRENIRVAQLEGIPTFFGNILAEELEELELGGLGKLFAMTGNSEVNLLAIQRGGELFERKECYRLSMPAKRLSSREVGREALRGRVLFSDEATYDNLDQRFAEGAVVKVTKLSDEFTMSDFSEKYPDALLMFVIDAMGGLNVVATDSIIEPGSSDTVMALVKASDV